MSRRHDRRRRTVRAERERHDLFAPSGVPFESARAISRWLSKLSTLTSRGFTSPPFAQLVFDPAPGHRTTVVVDPIQDGCGTRIAEPIH